MAGDDHRWQAMIEEALRWSLLVARFMRWARHDTEICGQENQ
jgi:cytochrome P450